VLSATSFSVGGPAGRTGSTPVSASTTSTSTVGAEPPSSGSSTMSASYAGSSGSCTTAGAGADASGSANAGMAMSITSTSCESGSAGGASTGATDATRSTGAEAAGAASMRARPAAALDAAIAVQRGGSAATRPRSRNSPSQSRNDTCARRIRSRTAGVTGRSSSSSRLWMRSTSHASSPSSFRPTIRPEPLSVWNPRRTVRSASRSPGLSTSARCWSPIVSSTSVASVR
jgi:hypothetical protein